MRISTYWNQQSNVNRMLDQQVKLNDIQLKLSSGQKYLTPSENPAVAATGIDLQQNIKEGEQYQVNIGFAKQRLGLEESTLNNATEVLQKIRELAVQGMNDINTAENRKQIAFEIDELNQHLLELANTQNANGEYIFSGYKTDAPAFSNSSGYSYDGDANQRTLTIGPGRTITDGDPGEAVFGTVAAGTLTAGSIDNVFQAIDKLSTDFKADVANSASLNDLDTTLKRMGTIRASAGARLNALDSQDSWNTEYILQNKSTASDIGDLDYADALTKFNLQQTSLQAAQQAYVKVQQLSLFNYI
ncbi:MULTISPECIES: flagellar hook-associated protein FlgL [Methylomonas]|uniref:flagellar hook-associated protein FlgL n=1 Tax=Methylomonas TaxID=416 RepID=UPI001231A0BD|nr:flagellar hook-associated protein FlgL [Methylomonas rhizoryzae]